MTPFITAHRGCSQLAPENTMPAIELAIQMQADFVEIDVQETQDHSLVVIHDSQLSRLAGVDCHVWELTARELEKLDVGQWFSDEFKNTRIPSLASVMDLAQDKIQLNLELKIHGYEQDLVHQVVHLIHRKNWQKDCVISSMNRDILRQVKTLDSTLAIGPVMPPSQSQCPNFDVDFYSIHYTLATPKFIDQAHAEGKAVHVWTVNKPSEMERLLGIEIDNIITDQPSVLKELVALNR